MLFERFLVLLFAGLVFFGLRGIRSGRRGLFEDLVQKVNQFFVLFSQVIAGVGLLFPFVQQLVGEVQGRQDRDFLAGDDIGMQLDFFHFVFNELRQRMVVERLRGISDNLIGLAKNLDRNFFFDHDSPLDIQFAILLQQRLAFLFDLFAFFPKPVDFRHQFADLFVFGSEQIVFLLHFPVIIAEFPVFFLELLENGDRRLDFLL